VARGSLEVVRRSLGVEVVRGSLGVLKGMRGPRMKAVKEILTKNNDWPLNLRSSADNNIWIVNFLRADCHHSNSASKSFCCTNPQTSTAQPSIQTHNQTLGAKCATQHFFCKQ
jgi:hypothetical protein